jgi:riboflavin kinase/FMN adenylyltransferase
MRVIRGLYNAQRSERGAVLTIGNFDGLHRGHRALIERTREHAQRLHAETVVLSFDPTAREFFLPAEAPGRIGTFRGQLLGFSGLGVDQVIVQRFGRHFAQWEAEAFVREGLVQRLGLRGVVIGDDFRFGARRAGDLELLRRLGTENGFFVDAMPSVCTQGGLRCSSTAVREALAAPNLDRAERLLGRPYSIVGRVRGGLRLGRKLGMPTANIVLRRRPALRLGIYVVSARPAGGDAPWWPGVANVGVRPTLGLTQCLLETHVLEGAPNLYGQTLEVRLQHFLRPEARFDSVDALAEQMHRDKADALAFFRSATDN